MMRRVARIPAPRPAAPARPHGRAGRASRAPRLTNQRGTILLLEAVLGMFLLSLAVIPVFYSLGLIAMSTEKSKIVTMARNLLQEEVENVKLQEYDSIASRTLRNFEGAPIAIEEIVSETSMPGVKKVILHAYREPMDETSYAIDSVEFLVYEGGF